MLMAEIVQIDTNTKTIPLPYNIKYHVVDYASPLLVQASRSDQIAGDKGKQTKAHDYVVDVCLLSIRDTYLPPGFVLVIATMSSAAALVNPKSHSDMLAAHDC